MSGAPHSDELRRALAVLARAAGAPAGSRIDGTAIGGPELGPRLERLWERARGVDPDALEIVRLRHEGFSDRDIADRLGLGLRLVRRIAADVGPI